MFSPHYFQYDFCPLIVSWNVVIELSKECSRLLRGSRVGCTRSNLISSPMVCPYIHQGAIDNIPMLHIDDPRILCLLSYAPLLCSLSGPFLSSWIAVNELAFVAVQFEVVFAQCHCSVVGLDCRPDFQHCCSVLFCVLLRV